MSKARNLLKVLSTISMAAQRLEAAGHDVNSVDPANSPFSDAEEVHSKADELAGLIVPLVGKIASMKKSKPKTSSKTKTSRAQSG